LISASVGIPVFNEERNIGKLLERISELNPKTVKINEVIIVSSGSTDNTDLIIESFVRDKPLFVYIKEAERKGKANAVNEIIKRSTGEIIYLLDGDIMPLPENFDLMAKHFSDPEIGGVGSRNVPLSDTGDFMGFIANELWYTYHHVCSLNPKLGGDLIAFRKSFNKIVEQTSIDDQAVELAVRVQGYRVVYEPMAINLITGPRTVRDFLIQRRRIHAGYYALGERPQTVKIGTGLIVLKHIFWNIGFVFLEVYARFLGWLDYKRGKKHIVWQRINE
jgi:glycosyltransferase involved in cell wall biosynthesis